ncbi:acyltransferase [Mesonia ostreae]|uniref:Acyltransferase n=1 Tax=Mesonia ostreae TaxID=861110 RepID=A0ABU2KM07_9FLAO|nr:acyltransferase [Mesonia ostreae]MDT0295756.1 acyltransferase [Mesonia ostreae]
MIHISADVNSNDIGENTHVWQFSVILAGAKIGKNCNINCHVFIENNVSLGDNVTIKPGVQIWDGITIGNNVFIGPNATFTNDILPKSKVYPTDFQTTHIEDFVSIGANATILPNLHIGKGAFIGAGAVVTKNVKPFQIVLGNPAKPIGYLTRNKVRLDLNLLDEEGNLYEIKNNELERLHD